VSHDSSEIIGMLLCCLYETFLIINGEKTVVFFFYVETDTFCFSIPWWSRLLMKYLIISQVLISLKKNLTDTSILNCSASQIIYCSVNCRSTWGSVAFLYLISHPSAREFIRHASETSWVSIETQLCHTAAGLWSRFYQSDMVSDT